MTIIDLQDGTISARYHFGVFSLGFHRRNGRKYHLGTIWTKEKRNRKVPVPLGNADICLLEVTLQQTLQCFSSDSFFCV